MDNNKIMEAVRNSDKYDEFINMICTMVLDQHKCYHLEDDLQTAADFALIEMISFLEESHDRDGVTE